MKISASLVLAASLFLCVASAQAQNISNGTVQNPHAMIKTVAAVHNSPRLYTDDDLAVYAQERIANTPRSTVKATSSTDSAEAADTNAAKPNAHTQQNQQKKPVDAAKQQAEVKQAGLKQTISLLEREIALDQRQLELDEAYTNIDLRSTSENGEDLARERKALQAELQKKKQELTQAKSQLQGM